MTIVKIIPEYIEHFSLELTPKRTYIAADFDPTSGTYRQITGTLDVNARASHVVKDVRPNFSRDNYVTEGDASDLSSIYDEARRAASSAGSNYGVLEHLLKRVAKVTAPERFDANVDVIRFRPPATLNADFMRKRVIRELLFPYYRVTMPSLHWAYSNYVSLNFFTGSSVPSDTVLMYPNTNAAAGVTGNVYIPQGPFTFDFRINPRYTTTSPDEHFRAGTLFHVSGVFALSILSGTHVDHAGLPDRFRIALQVLSGTYTPPSMITTGTSEIFISDDVLQRNHWHRVVVRWGTLTRNGGTGSFVVDGVEAGTFVFPSASLIQALGDSPDVLYVGNFYEGPHTGSNTQARFFSSDVATREGLVELQANPTTGDRDRPMTPIFRHPLNAEVRELRIWREYLTDDDIDASEVISRDDLHRLMFYVPPFFTHESPTRRVVDGIGGVLQTPFFGIDGTTDDPFNVAMSFGVGALYVNLENFTRDFARNNWPRAYNLTASQIASTADVKSATEFLYATGSVRKRNLTIVPCDDGTYTPDFSLLTTSSLRRVPSFDDPDFHYANDLGVLDPSFIRLTELIPTGSLYTPIIAESGSLFDAVIGATPENPGVDPGEALAIFQRTRDNSSNEVTIFDVSNLYYGRRILPGSLTLTDNALTGSGGRISITLRDDGCGNLYRADAATEHAKWASVGNVLYDEGIIVVKSPNLPYFGRDGFQLDFRASHNVHTLKIRVPAGAGLHNSSSNPSYVPASASLAANEIDPNFVYITGLHLHDADMNVVMKTTLAQPIVKRTGDKFVVKVGYDY